MNVCDKGNNSDKEELWKVVLALFGVFHYESFSAPVCFSTRRTKRKKNKDHRNILSVTRIYLEHQRQTSGHFHISLLYAHSRYWPLVPHFVDGLLGNGHEVLV